MMEYPYTSQPGWGNRTDEAKHEENRTLGMSRLLYQREQKQHGRY